MARRDQAIDHCHRDSPVDAKIGHGVADPIGVNEPSKLLNELQTSHPCEAIASCSLRWMAKSSKMLQVAIIQPDRHKWQSIPK